MEATYPWLCPLDTGLVSKTEDFMKFLQYRMINLKPKDELEIKMRLDSLTRWINISRQLLSIGRCPNFVDAFPIPIENVSFMGKCSSFDGQIWTVISFDEMFGPINNESKFSTVSIGYMFDTKADCLRNVCSKNESRQIFKAKKCSFDPETKAIVQIMDEHVIVKRVGKHPRNTAFNTRLMREFKVQYLLSSLNHESFNKIMHFTEDHTCFISISKYGGKKDLLDTLQIHVETFKKGFAEQTVVQLFKPAVEALLIAHNMNICHRDISLENFVVNDYDLKNPHLEVIDWGHSASAQIGSNLIRYEGPIGKSKYFSPELVDTSKAFYDPFKADVFALGVCLYSCVAGSMPLKDMLLKDDSRLDILKEKGARELIEISNLEVSEVTKDLLDGCMRWNSEERLSMTEVLTHPFFNPVK